MINDRIYMEVRVGRFRFSIESDDANDGPIYSVERYLDSKSAKDDSSIDPIEVVCVAREDFLAMLALAREETGVRK